MIASQVLALADGMSYRQLNTWTNNGYIHATAGGDGAGYAREYDQVEARVAALMYRLTQAGLNVPAAHRVARQVVAGQPAELAPGIHVVVREDR